MHYSPRNVLCCLTVSRFILAIAIDSYFLKPVPYIAQIYFSKKKKKKKKKEIRLNHIKAHIE